MTNLQLAFKKNQGKSLNEVTLIQKAQEQLPDL
jgi:hypothetical protein